MKNANVLSMQDPIKKEKWLEQCRNNRKKPASVEYQKQYEKTLKGIEARKKQLTKYKKVNAAKVNAKNNNRRADKLLRTPKWANLLEIESIYKECQKISKETGILHHVDHIVPLKGKIVSGLHWEDNLQIIPAKLNMQKNNSWRI
ncbi:MAG: hypothetical protein ACOYMH_00065 [Zwartia sp.]